MLGNLPYAGTAGPQRLMEVRRASSTLLSHMLPASDSGGGVNLVVTVGELVLASLERPDAPAVSARYFPATAHAPATLLTVPRGWELRVCIPRTALVAHVKTALQKAIDRELATLLPDDPLLPLPPDALAAGDAAASLLRNDYAGVEACESAKGFAYRRYEDAWIAHAYAEPDAQGASGDTRCVRLVLTHHLALAAVVSAVHRFGERGEGFYLRGGARANVVFADEEMRAAVRSVGTAHLLVLARAITGSPTFRAVDGAFVAAADAIMEPGPVRAFVQRDMVPGIVIVPSPRVVLFEHVRRYLAVHAVDATPSGGPVRRGKGKSKTALAAAEEKIRTERRGQRIMSEFFTRPK